MAKDIRVRFAPSPTGHLHVGSVRVAIFNWLFARHYNGKYVLRIEDTDVLRSKQEYVDSMLSSLKWLNLMPDEEPLLQSSRIDTHKKAAQDFLKNGLAYPCFCAPKGEDGAGAAEEECACGQKKFSQEELEKPHAIRFRVPKTDGAVKFDDLIRGEISFDHNQLNDFIIVRQDGTPTYNLVVVLDDIFMNISHVVRGEDHISNTPKQILLYQALGANVPVFAHLPLILNEEGKRLSKRDAVVSVEEYRAQGFLPDALFNYLVRLGWSHGDQEVFTKDEMVKYFDLKDVGKKGAVFDIKKLEWLNGIYIRQSSVKDILGYIDAIPGDLLSLLQNTWSDDKLEALIEQYKERAVTLKDMAESILRFASDPEELDVELISKWLKPYTGQMLQKYADEIGQLEDFSHDPLLEAARVVFAQFESKLVAVAQPLRLALTGSNQSPGIFEMMSILGKEQTVNRLNKLIEKL